jgi:hypothetical protein
MNGPVFLLLAGVAGALVRVLEQTQRKRIDARLRPKYERGGGWYSTRVLGLFALGGSLFASAVAVVLMLQSE